MATMHKARFTNGVLKPLDDDELREGDEVVYVKAGAEPAVLERKDPVRAAEALERTAGGWVGLIDCEEFKRMIYESRERGSRDRFEP